MNVENKIEAYKTLQEALKVEPENTEINAELKELREEMTGDEIKQLEGNQGGNFKKIVIEEDSEEEEMEEKN